METININDKDISTSFLHFVIAAIVKVEKNKNIQFFSNEKGDLAIEFKINGIEIPFKATIEEIYQGLENNINTIATVKALEIIKLNGLDGLGETLQKCEKLIAEKIYKITGVSLDKED